MRDSPGPLSGHLRDQSKCEYADCVMKCDWDKGLQIRGSSLKHLKMNFPHSFSPAPANESLPNECENGDVRLVNGSIPNEGRVELCFHGHWGTVCSDTWNNMDAAVVCRELGFNSEGTHMSNQ